MREALIDMTITECRDVSQLTKCTQSPSRKPTYVLESGTSTLALMAELRNLFLVRRTNVPDSWDLQKFLIE